MLSIRSIICIIYLYHDKFEWTTIKDKVLPKKKNSQNNSLFKVIWTSILLKMSLSSQTSYE